jgi:uncharacterized membrane protein
MNLSKRIYTIFLVSVGLWCVAIVAAPVLHGYGGSVGRSIGDALYFGFAKICHQIDGRSLHVFGEKFGVCVRCTSIYFSFLAGLLFYLFVRALETNNVTDKRWLIVGILPMVIDAFLNDFGIHQSGDALRAVTGSIAGFVLALYILPLFIEALTQLTFHRNLQGDTRYAGQTK